MRNEKSFIDRDKKSSIIKAHTFMMCAFFLIRRIERTSRVRKVLIAGSIKGGLKSPRGIRTSGSIKND